MCGDSISVGNGDCRSVGMRSWSVRIAAACLSVVSTNYNNRLCTDALLPMFSARSSTPFGVPPSLLWLDCEGENHDGGSGTVATAAAPDRTLANGRREPERSRRDARTVRRTVVLHIGLGAGMAIGVAMGHEVGVGNQGGVGRLACRVRLAN